MYAIIRAHIGQMEPGEFEDLLRVVLPLDDEIYSDIYDTLNLDGKTTKGPVDLFAYKKYSGKYTAISVTTTKSEIIKKVKNDISKLNSETCLIREDIDEVLVCVNTPIKTEDSEYRKLCAKNRWEYSAYPLNKLASIVSEHPTVADNLCAKYILEIMARIKQRDGDMIKAHIEKEYGMKVTDRDVSMLLSTIDKSYLCGKRIGELRNDLDLSHSRFVDLIEFKSELTLSRIEANEVEVTEPEIESICDKTGCSMNWLKHNEYARYEFEEIHTSEVSKIEHIKGFIPQHVYVLINRDDMGLVLLAHINSFKWKMFTFTFALDFDKWWGDEHHITDIFELFSAIQNDFGIAVSGRYISKAVYKECTSGMIHPSKVVEQSDRSGKHWFEDVLDIDDKYGMSQGYDKWFLTIQDYFRRYRPK